jgi:hypothetical protein
VQIKLAFSTKRGHTIVTYEKPQNKWSDEQWRLFLEGQPFPARLSDNAPVSSQSSPAKESAPTLSTNESEQEGGFQSFDPMRCRQCRAKLKLILRALSQTKKNFELIKSISEVDDHNHWQNEE